MEKPLEKLSNEELLNKLKAEGVYPCLMKKGIIPLKVNLYFEINNLYKVQLVVNEKLNDCIMQSLTDVSISFNCHENTVRNAVNMMKQ